MSGGAEPGPGARPIPVRAGSLLVSAFPLSSGHGQVARSMFDLGLFARMWLFKIRRHDSEAGYDRVIRPRLPVSYASAFLSLYLPGPWSREVQKASWVHFNSPHFFQLSRYNPHCSGTVHDVMWLDPRTHSRRDTPMGTRWFFPRALRHIQKLAGVVVVSRATEQALRAIYPGVSTTVIHPWTQDTFQPRDRMEVRRRLGLPEDRKIVLQVSIDNVRKNLEVLPKIMEHLPPDFLLVRIGPSERIQSLFPTGRLRALPAVSAEDYPLYFSAADAVLVPSFDEGFGVPIIEALNSGVPVVASDIPVFREVLRDDHPYLAKPTDVERWAALTREAVERGTSDPRSTRLYGPLVDYYRPSRGEREYRAFYQHLGLLPGP